jgi:hypothetical protein
MEFYVTDSVNNNLRHRVVYDDVIFCHSFADGVILHLHNKSNIILKNSVDVIYDFYFKKPSQFIRSSEHHIVNTSHIKSAEELGNEIVLHLTNDLKAKLRRSHEYAYFIINGQKKVKDAIENCEVKDALVMSEIKDIRQIVDSIKKATGDVVTSRWVVKRYKQLKIKL